MTENPKLRITVLKRLSPFEIFGENIPATFVPPLEPCPAFKDGQQFVIDGPLMPDDFPCNNAWHAMYQYVRALAWNARIPWYREGNVATPCCPDGLRPVIFKVERIE